MRTWELNTFELLELVEETGVKNIIVRATPEMVGRTAIARILEEKDSDPLAIADLGKILYVTKDGVKVQLIGTKKGVAHEDGEEGEVFIQTYTSRRKHKSDALPRRCAWVCIGFVFACICLFVVFVCLYFNNFLFDWF